MLWLMFVFLCSGFTHASPSWFRAVSLDKPEHGLSGTVRPLLSNDVKVGYFPVQITLLNSWDTPRKLHWRVHNSYQKEAYVTGEILLPVKGEVKQELLIPVSSRNSGPWELAIYDENDEVVSKRRILGQFMALQNSPTTMAITKLYQNHAKILRPWLEVAEHEWDSKSYLLHKVNYADVPQSFMGYSSLDLVLLEAPEVPLADFRFTPLFQWVVSGGTLVVIGKNAQEYVATNQNMQPWIKDRFREPVSLIGKDLKTLKRYDLPMLRMGQSYLLRREGEAYTRSIGREAAKEIGEGLLQWKVGKGQVVVAQEIFSKADVLAFMGSLVYHQQPWLQQVHRAQHQPVQVSMSRTVEKKKYYLMATLVLLFIIMVPINLIMTRQVRTRFALLITTPLLSACCCVAIVLYVVFVQGTSTQAVQVQSVLLDQRNHTANIESVLATMARIDNVQSLELPSNNWLVPQHHDKEQGSYHLYYKQGRPQFAGDFLPDKKVKKHRVLAVQKTRLRLDFNHGIVVNALGGKVEELLYRDFQGEYWQLSSSMTAGQSGKLQLLTDEQRAAWLRRPTVQKQRLQQPHRYLFADKKLKKGTYVALLSESPFEILPDLQLEFLEQDIWILGVL